MPICITCVKNEVVNDDGTVNQNKLKRMCQRLDKPFYLDDLDSSFKQCSREHGYLSDDEIAKNGKEIVGFYFKNAMLRQNREKSYADSEREGFMHQNSNKTKGEISEIKRVFSDDGDASSSKEPKAKPKSQYKLGKFKATDDIKSLFGYGYDDVEYKKMFDKYEKLKLNYTLQTNLHQEALATYVRFKVKEEDATARGDVDEAKKWYDAAQNAAANGKLTPKTLSAADFQKGMNSVSELVKAVEQATDVIKILPQFKYRPNDSVDFTIMCYINYERKLNGQPEVEYEDVYSFYDKRRDEYIKQHGDPYGIFDGDPTEKNRETVKTFLKMPEDYDELMGDTDE